MPALSDWTELSSAKKYPNQESRCPPFRSIMVGLTQSSRQEQPMPMMLDFLIHLSTFSKSLSMQLARHSRIPLPGTIRRPLGQPLQRCIVSVAQSNTEPIAPGTLLKSDLG